MSLIIFADSLGEIRVVGPFENHDAAELWFKKFWEIWESSYSDGWHTPGTSIYDLGGDATIPEDRRQPIESPQEFFDRLVKNENPSEFFFS